MFTILYAVAGYFFLMLMVRLLTRRPGAQMTMSSFWLSRVGTGPSLIVEWPF
jgi:hypothetical protein